MTVISIEIWGETRAELVDKLMTWMEILAESNLSGNKKIGD